MTQEEKGLLIKDLCGRLPYGVKVKHEAQDYSSTLIWVDVNRVTVGRKADKIGIGEDWGSIEFIKPYLRPMSSMTEEERNEYEDFIIHREHINAQGQEWDIDCFSFDNSPRLIDWLNAHHFDYRDLIEKELALEASKEMYKEEQQ